MATTMRAIDIRGGKGERDALFMNPDTPRPVPKPDQVFVKVRAFGINRMDIVQRRGNYPLPPQAPATLGVEFSGVVEELGADVEPINRFHLGDEVFGLAYGGAYAEYIAVSAKMLINKPHAMTWVQAAAVPEAWITATQALHLVLGFETGKSVLWHAGASGVSIAGIQLAKLAGASAVYATAGTDEKCAFLKELGVTAAFNYKTTDWVAGVKEATEGKGVNYIIDYIGAKYFQKNLDAAALDAGIVMLGTMGGTKVPEANLAPILFKRLRIEGSTLRSRDEDYQAWLRDKLESYMPAFEAEQLKIIVNKVFPWEEIQEAHKYMEEAKNKWQDCVHDRVILKPLPNYTTPVPRLAASTMIAMLVFF